ncbi:hypothetical protein [Parabacteroides bouchesdurhonensis]|nr:hypothetical protein [Parabacteroides bouchesdurhonensis]
MEQKFQADGTSVSCWWNNCFMPVEQNRAFHILLRSVLTNKMSARNTV